MLRLLAASVFITHWQESSFSCKHEKGIQQIRDKLSIAVKFPQYVGSSENHVPGGWSKLQNQREKINLKINGV